MATPVRLLVPVAALLLAACGETPAPRPPSAGPAPAGAASPAAAAPAATAADDLPAERELIVDGGFEGAAPGRWVENNWAGNQVEFVRDRDRPFRGAASQRMALLKVTSRPSLQLLQPLAGVRAGDALRVRLAVRGLANSRPLEVMVRKIDAPYTSFGHLRLPITEDWQVAGFVAVLPPQVPPDIGLYIQVAEENTVWVDEVSVGVLPAVDPRPLPAGNLLANGSFEVGTARWSANYRGTGPDAAVAETRVGADDFAAVELPGVPDGRRALRVRVHQDGRVAVNSAWFPYRHGRPLTVSFDLRAAAGPGGPVAVSLGLGEAPNVTRVVERTVAAGAAWQRHTLTCTPGPSDQGRLFLELAAGTPGEYLIDRVQAEQAPGAPALELGCEAVTPVPGGIHRGSERPRLRVRAANGGAGAALAAEVTVEDAWGAEVARLPLALTLDAAGAGSAEVDLPAARFGGFRATVRAGGRLMAEHLYCVVPELPRPDGSGASFFGGHFQFSAHGLDLAERAGFRWLRLHPPLLTKWSVVEPVQGRRRFPVEQITAATARGFSVLGSLDAPPKWASSEGVDKPYVWWHNRIPRDWNEWSGYVQDAVRSLPQIRAWEVYNEPDGDFLVVKPGEDKVARYVELLQRTRQAVEATGAPVELVGLAVSSLDRPFFREVLAKGGGAAVDSLAFHFYYEDLDPFEKTPSFLEQLAALRAPRNRAGAEPAIWHTEGGMWLRRSPSWLALSGIPDTEGNGQLDGAHALVRIAATLKALGVKRHFQYAGLTSPAGGLVYRSECSGLFDVDGSARPAVAAHAAMVWLLDRAEPAGAETVAVGAAQVRLARFRDPRRGAITVAWSRQPLAASAVPGLLDGVTEVRDLMGNPLTGAATIGPAPVYLIAGR